MAVFGDFLLVKMTIKDQDGKVLEEGKDKGDVYVYGLNRILPKVDMELSKMKVGDKKTLVLEAGEAYGPVVPELVKTYPVSKFKQAPQVGDVLESRGPDGQVFKGLVKKVENGRITIDFNSPYAGKNLKFDLEVKGLAKDEVEKLKFTLIQYDAENEIVSDTNNKKLTTKSKEVYEKVLPTIAFLFPEYEFKLEN